MATPHRNAPVLRFSEFLGKWANKKIKSIAPLQRGFDLPTTRIKKGKYPVVYSNGILRTHNEFKVTGPSVVTGRSGTIGQVTFINKNFWPHNTSLWVTDFCGNDPKFIYYFFIQIRLKKYNAGSSIPTLNRNDVHSIKASIPESLKEQQKIATFLSSVDTKIEHLGKKKALLEQYKKGMMQKLFSQEIRFKDEQGNDYLDWEGNTLGMLFEISAGGDIENSYSRKNKDGIFRYPIYANSEKAKGLHGYSDRYRVKQNCITVSGRGALGVAHARFEKFFPIVRLLVLIPRKESNLIFFEHAINLLQIFNESTGVPQLTAPQLKKYHLIYPSINEQHKIANFLSAIDKKIELITEQLEQARTFKKGLLQQMFI